MPKVKEATTMKPIQLEIKLFEKCIFWARAWLPSPPTKQVTPHFVRSSQACRKLGVLMYSCTINTFSNNGSKFLLTCFLSETLEKPSRNLKSPGKHTSEPRKTCVVRLSHLLQMCGSIVRRSSLWLPFSAHHHLLSVPLP